MKKFFLLVLASICFTFMQAQVFINRSGPANTVVDARLGIKYNLVIPRFKDTTEANTQLGKDSAGAIIFTRADNIIWKRQLRPRKWVMVSGSGTGSTTGCGLNYGGKVTWITGLNFAVSAANYCISNTNYSSLSGTVTVNAADSLPRLDIIGVDTLGNIFKITGVPSANPSAPQVNPKSQLYLTTIFIPAGATQPAGVSSVTLWDENTGAPEYTASGASINTDSPYHLITAAHVFPSSFPTNINFNGVSYSNTDYSSIRFFVNIKESMGPYDNIRVRLNNTTDITLSALYGFNKNIVGTYQNITIPLSDFVYTQPTTVINQVIFTSDFDAFVNQLIYLDFITLNGGLSVGGNTGFITNVYRIPGTDSVMKVIDGRAIFAFKDSTGSGGGSVSLSPVGLTSNPNGLSITGSVLNGQPADQFNPGFLTALNQYIGGEKTFFAPITARIMQGFRLFNTINLNDRGDILYTSRGRGGRGESNIYGRHVFDTYAFVDSFLLSVAETGNIKFKVLRNGTVRLTGLSTGSVPPVTIAGTIQQVITDANGDLSFQDFTSTNLDLGIADIFTQPITNSNGTGFTLSNFTTTAGLVPGTVSDSTKFLNASGDWRVPAPVKVTTLQKNAIVSPQEGMQVYDLTLHQMSYWNGTVWLNF